MIFSGNLLLDVFLARKLLLLFVICVFAPISHATLAQDDSAGEVPGVTIHVVQRGESLYRIAQRYELTIDDIARVNGIIDTTNIQVGQRLLIPLDVRDAPPAPVIHVIQPGESLQGIADAYQISLDTLMATNNITDVNAIFLGQVLDIVVADNGIMQSAENLDATVNLSESSNARIMDAVHVVESGETLFRIATNYGLTVTDLQNANNISDPTRIFAGQELIIPGTQAVTEVINLPQNITRLDVAPLTLVEGQTGQLLITTSQTATLDVRFMERSFPVITEDGLNFMVFLPVPVWTSSGIYPITISLTVTGQAQQTITVNVQVSAGPYGSQYITLPEDRIELLSAAVENNELNILSTTASGFSAERYFDGPMSLPAAAAMNSPFGTRRSYNGSAFDRYHSGADFAGAPGSPILAAASGWVVLADVLNIRGSSIMLDHGWGVFTHYAHMSERYVQFGDFVEAGQIIGTVGSSGRATGAHLHWELWVNGVTVDPMQWVTQAFP